MTFREYCAAAAMRELLRMAANKKPDDDTAFCHDLAEGAFAIADAMVKAAGPEPSRYGAAPSRARGGE